MNYDNIPQLIKNTGQFCTVRYEKRRGHMTKVPYNPVTGQKASVDKPETFVDFKTAVAAVGSYDGIGICVNGKLIAIDLDHCIENGVLLPWAKEIVGYFRDTYIEISPSGTGIRILVLRSDGYVYDSKTFYIKKGNVPRAVNVSLCKHFCSQTLSFSNTPIHLTNWEKSRVKLLATLQTEMLMKQNAIAVLPLMQYLILTTKRIVN